MSAMPLPLPPLVITFVVMLTLGSLAVAILAWLHPEWLTVSILGFGAISLMVLLVMLVLMSGKQFLK